MPTAEILNSHPVSTLKKEISKTNIKGYSKMKKPELVKLMLKNKERFSHIKMNTKEPRAKPKPKPVEPKPKPKPEEPKPKPVKPKPKPKKPKSAEKPKDVIANFPFKKSSGGRPLGLDEDDLTKFAVDRTVGGPGSSGFVFLTKAQLLKRLTRAAAKYRPGGFFSGRLGDGFREMFDEQEKYIKDGNYNPPKGVVAELVKKGRNVVPEFFDKPIPLARYKKSKQ
tara:strand:+ start:261 stop:932 length:672 start_codon:yes stop_codon:yes gene_type:complete